MRRLRPPLRSVQPPSCRDTFKGRHIGSPSFRSAGLLQPTREAGRRYLIRLDAVTMILTACREAGPAIGLLRLNLLVRHMAQHQSGQHDCDDQSGRKHPCLSPSTDAGSLIRILGAFGVKVVRRLF